MGPRRLRTTTAVVLAGFALCAPAAARAADHAVSFPMTSPAGAYTPSTVDVIAGDTVTFTGAFSFHPLAWGDNAFPTESSGTSHTYTLNQAGTFAFFCTVHASMTGTVHVAANQLATPDFAWSPAQPQAGQTVTFTAGTFTDPDGSITRYDWDLDGDGTFETQATGPQVARSYAAASTVRVALRYVDDRGATSPATGHDVVVRPGAAGGGGGGGAGTGGPGGGSPGTGGGSSPAAAPGEQGAGPAPTSTAPAVRAPSRTLTFRGGLATLRLTAMRAGRVTVTLRRRGTLLARGSRTARKAGPLTVRLALTKAGRSRLAAGRPVTATLTVTQGRARRQATLVLRT
jgi:YD repeat-containing protein